MHMETLAGRACRDRCPSLVDGVSSPLKAIYLYLLLGVKLVSEAETAAGALAVAVKYERVLSIHFTVDVARLLKVVNGQVTKNGLATVSRTRWHRARLRHLLLLACVRTGREVGMIGRIGCPIRERLYHFLIVGVVDGRILRLQAARGRATDLVLDAIHSYWFANRRRTVLLLLVML